MSTTAAAAATTTVTTETNMKTLLTDAETVVAERALNSTAKERIFFMLM